MITTTSAMLVKMPITAPISHLWSSYFSRAASPFGTTRKRLASTEGSTAIPERAASLELPELPGSRVCRSRHVRARVLDTRTECPRAAYRHRDAQRTWRFLPPVSPENIQMRILCTSESGDSLYFYYIMLMLFVQYPAGLVVFSQAHSRL